MEASASETACSRLTRRDSLADNSSMSCRGTGGGCGAEPSAVTLGARTEPNRPNGMLL